MSAPEHQVPFADNAARKRFEIEVDGEVAFLDYDRTQDRLALIHTEVPVALRGRHIGDRLVEGALKVARTEGLRVVAICPFARAYLQKQHDRAT